MQLIILRTVTAILFLSTFGIAMKTTAQTTAATKEVSASRVQEIAKRLQTSPSGVGRAITDRDAWRTRAGEASFKDAVQNAEAIAARPIPPLTDEQYLEYSRNGNRSHWEAVYFRRRAEFGALVTAECIEDRGRFLEKINEHLDAFCAMRTWVWPAHDKGSRNFNGKIYDIDLGAAELSWQLATARWLLADRLTPERSKLISDNITRRVIKPYLAAATGAGPLISFMTRTNNWNAVCHAGVIGAAMATVPDCETRALFIASAEKYTQYFLDGFGADGYCAEGLGYWNYGFGDYVMLAETVRQATGGKIDLMDRPGVRAIAGFGTRIQIMDGVAPAFADCAIHARPAPQVVQYANGRFGPEAGKGSHAKIVAGGNLYEVMLYAFLDPATLPKLHAPEGATSDSLLRTWFDASGILIARPASGSTCRIGVALKGGNNGEPHNHNDLGSYVVVIDGDPVLLDPGGEHYTARTFSSRRYESKLLSSFGHPVPLVAGKLQRTGAEARAKMLRTEFTDTTDTLVMDLRSAYELKDLKRLERTFIYDRRGTGSLTVMDHVEFKSPQTFGTALISLGEFTPRDRGFVVTHEKHALHVQIEAAAAAFKTEQEQIHEDADVAPYRMGINLAEKTTSATITVKITVP